MEDNKKQYLQLMSEIIAKQAVILGPDAAILKAKKAGVITDHKGNVTDVEGDAFQTFKQLVDGYKELLGQTAENVINPILEKYPQIKGLIKLWFFLC